MMCPYCEREFIRIAPAHLKKHGKTCKKAMEEFPHLTKWMLGYPVVARRWEG